MIENDAAFIHDTLMRISAKMESQNKSISRDMEKLTMAEVRALLVLKVGDAANMSRIAGMLGVAVSTATTTVDRLVAKKLGRRRVAKEDRRQWLVELTPKAEKLIEELEKRAIAGTQKFLECLSSSEIAFLKDILGRIDNTIQAGSVIAVNARTARRPRKRMAGTN